MDDDGYKPHQPGTLPEMTALVFDCESLLERLMGDRELAGFTVQGFVEDVPGQLTNLCARLDQADAAGVSLQAHSLKGASATVSAEEMHATAMAIESAARAGHLDQCRQLASRVANEFDRFKSSIANVKWIRSS